MLLIYKSFEEIPGELRTQVSVQDNEWVVDVMPSSEHFARTANIRNQNVWYQTRLGHMSTILDEVRSVMLFAAEHREHYVVKVDQFQPDVDFRDWCKRNCKGPFYAFVLEPTDRDPKPTIFGVFAVERDATLFKLFLTE